MYIAAKRAHIEPFRDYVLLGDDIVIRGAKLALEYEGLLRELDVPISEAKTHVSIDT